VAVEAKNLQRKYTVFESSVNFWKPKKPTGASKKMQIRFLNFLFQVDHSYSGKVQVVDCKWPKRQDTLYQTLNERVPNFLAKRIGYSSQPHSG
jgi:hypothetical protein